MGRLLLSALAAALLQGCTREVLPEYPSHDTAVVRTRLDNHGFKGLFASQSTLTVATRADRRREESEFKFSGFVMSRLASARDWVAIQRADKDKQWRLDPKAKTYVECPLLGCPAPARPAAAPRPEEARPEEKPAKKPSCPLTLFKNRFSVEPTAETKEINGFPTKRYKVAWEVVLQDKQKRKDTSSVAIDVWTTPEDFPRLAAARAVERAFASRLRDKAAERAGAVEAVPADAMKIISAQFLSGLTADQRASVMSAAREASKIRGRPVLTHLVWNLGGDACGGEEQAAPKEERSSGLDLSHGVSGLLGSAASAGAQKKAEEVAARPVFEFEEELEKAGVEPASDGLFEIPPSYKLTPAPR